MRYVFIFLLLVISGAAGFLVSFYRHKPTAAPAIIETFHSPATFVKQLEGDPEAGRKIFKEFCAVCHDKIPQIDVDAPSIANKKIWQALGQVGVPALLKNTITGAGAMPARGGCFECSDEQLQQAIIYMLEQTNASAVK